MLTFLKSSIGKKWIVALTGLIWIGYVLGHLAGNLQVFISPEQINKYAELLHSAPAFLWVARSVLIVAFFAHIATTIFLVRQNQEARGRAYEDPKYRRSTLASRWMIVSGLVVLSFITYHLLHLTIRSTDPRFQTLEFGGKLQSENDVYTMLVLGFQDPIVTLFYLVSVLLLSMHLSHGISSVLQTLGLNSKKIRGNVEWAGRLLAFAIFAGYASIPLAVISGFLRLH